MIRVRVVESLRIPQIRRNSTNPSFRGPMQLPRLPVPDLSKTLSRYLTSLEPFLLEDEKRGGTPYESSYLLRQRWAQEFEAGIGQLLQDRLLALDRASPHNWLDDNFWINKAYHEWRAPLLINSNWWLAFHDDNMIPESALSGESSNNRAGITFWQIRRSAWMVHRILDFKGRLDKQELHPETTRTGIWLRNSISQMFNIARIPKRFCDIFSAPPHPSSLPSLNLLLMVHNWCYTIPVYHPPNPPTSLPQLMKPHEIETRIRAVVVDVEQRLSNGETSVPIGTLSADGRDQWAENLEYLLSLHETNRNSHQAMLTSLMGLSLEHTTYTIAPTLSPSLAPKGISQQALDAHLHTIRANSINVGNRFFDKPFTLIVDPSTHAGATGEHSPCDALVPSIVAEYGIVESVDLAAFEGNFDITNKKDSRNWTRLDWIADEKIWKECAAAEERAKYIIKDSDDSVFWFENYGTDWIKSVARLAPDAYIQMVLQLAWYKTRGEFTATYETVLTRMFKHGRTETLRTLTRDGRDWVLTMVDPQTSLSARYTALRRAIQTHTRLTKEAATGRGIDRHLLGLKLMLRPQDGEVAALFDDELFNRSQQWKLSTSGLSAGHLFRGTGFGATHHDGYGINYLAAPSMIKFGIESKWSNPLTSTQSLKIAIAESLHEMMLVCSSPEVTYFHATSHL
ncbi:acyltransferase ChoActase/COT/CPT [Collybia nuda]|uniref:Acyltransferase ChoActase/COT/CPT n=1 Tax=Collybia nuda TaxID=64659 RepID=A0A9P5XTA4_9AGAR|nr:acyltransferase ChoActase/COT/CPT [Collybia nuda]